MHLKRITKIRNKFFIAHYVIIDAIDDSNGYCEELNIWNCWKYLREIIGYICGQWKDKKTQKRRSEHEEVS